MPVIRASTEGARPKCERGRLLRSGQPVQVFTERRSIGVTPARGIRISNPGGQSELGGDVIGTPYVRCSLEGFDQRMCVRAGIVQSGIVDRRGIRCRTEPYAAEAAIL